MTDSTRRDTRENEEVRDRPVVVVVTNGSLFATVGLRRVFAALGAQCDFRVVITTGLRKPGDNRAMAVIHLLAKWGFRYSIYKLLIRVGAPLYERITQTPVTVRGACKQMAVPTTIIRDINDDNGIAFLRSCEPTLLLSYACPYRIQAKALSIPSVGSLNAHSSLLPEYAGVGTYVHVLAEGREKTGVTIHEMVERFDAGRITGQEAIDIPPNISVAALFGVQCVMAGDLLTSVLPNVLEKGEVYGTRQDLSRRSYRREPNRHDIRRLRAGHHALLRTKEMPELLAVASGKKSTFSWDPRG